MGMSMHDRYYEPPDDDYDCDDVADRVAELMKDEYNPENYINFSEAISEANDKDREAVEAILQQPTIDYEALGRKLYSMAYDYMEHYAVSHAEEDLATGYRD